MSTSSKNKKNKHAKVWDADNANKFIQKVKDYVLNNEDCRSMATACSKLGSYEKVINYLRELPFSKDIDFNPINECHELIKSRLIEQGLDNKANATMAIFILKNNHGMSDKVETKSEVKVKEFSIKDTLKFVK